MFKKIIAYLLKIAAQILLWRKKPEVIAITGSAGKTTTRELLMTLLSDEFEVLISTEAYNTELGAPLALFREKSPTNVNSVLAWIGILARSYLKAIFIRRYPEKVIVEMGADAPGDIEYLARLFKPHKGVILTVLPVHLESFKNIENITEEKARLAQNIVTDGKAFLNIDDPRVAEMDIPGKVTKVTFGTKEGADFRAKNIKSDLTGLSFDLYEKGEKHQIKVRLYGEQMVYPLLAAIAVTRCDHVSYTRILAALKKVGPVRGRMNVIEGIEDSIIVDDSYNANPKSVIKALEFLGKQKGRKIALLGNMNELGQYEKEGHEQVGDKVAGVAEVLVTVGEIAAKYLAPAAISAGMPESNVHMFTNPDDAGKYLAKNIKKGDIILAKGSQNKVRLEKAIVKFMAHPEDRERLLARQSRFWQNEG